MATPKDVISKLEAALKVAHTFDDHIKKLTQIVAITEPSVNAMQALLSKVGFDKEIQVEDNLKLLIDHHTALVAESTILHKEKEERDALLTELRKVVTQHVE